MSRLKLLLDKLIDPYILTIEDITRCKIEILDINKHISQHNDIVKKFKTFNELFNTICDLKYSDVIDLIPNQKVKNTDTVFRTSRLLGVIEYLKDICLNTNYFGNAPKLYDKVLIEYQMSINDKSKIICNQLCAMFTTSDDGFKCYNRMTFDKDIDKTTSKIDKKKVDVHIVGCSLKNKLHFTNNLSYENVICKSSKTYTGNKNHCKYNFIEWANITGNENKISKIRKSELDDAGDAFMMSFVWFLENC
jgi:hypothetical protein